MRSFIITAVIGWAVLIPIAFGYARKQDLSPALAIPAVLAFLIEYIFYLVPGFPSVRERFSGRRLLPYLFVSVLLPYLVYAVPTHFFYWDRFAVLVTVAGTIVFWYAVLPRKWYSDIGFIATLAVILLSPVFKWIYPDPAKHVSVFILGHLFLIHTGAMVMLVQRHFPGLEFGFVPSIREMRIGAWNFLLFIPLGAALGLGLHLFGYVGKPAWQAPVVFAGYFLVVALGEEFAFRGVIQPSLRQATRSPQWALVLTSLCFGIAHLWFRGNAGFPNWRMAILASVAGWFYGRAAQQAGSILAAMIAHTLVVTVWLVWLY